jgi:hypothetical protein
MLGEVTEEEIERAVTPIHTLVWAKKAGKKWRQNASTLVMTNKMMKAI